MITTAAVAVIALLCPPCEEAELLLQEGDTSGAVSALEAAQPQDRTAVLPELGLLRALLAPSEEGDFAAREEAQQLLEEARKSNPRDPRLYLGLAVLARKRSSGADAWRLLERARDFAASAPNILAPADRALIHLERGRILEERVLDLKGLIANDRTLPVTAPNCSGAFCRNFTHPRDFNRDLLALPTVDHLAEDLESAMREEFATAFTLDPGSPRVARAWLGELARSGEWMAFRAVADAHMENQPAATWGKIYVAVGNYRSGASEEAAEKLQEALRAITPEEKSSLLDIRLVLDRRSEERYSSLTADQRRDWAEYLWLRSDPLYSTKVNERLLEHVIRWVLADLWFGNPETGVQGQETEPGRLLIRYGRPKHVRQIVRDQERARTAAALRSGKSIAEMMGESFQYFGESGGRWVIWNYAESTPSFIFEKSLRSRKLMHEGLSNSARFEQELREEGASAFSLDGLEHLDYQAVLFKGTDGNPELDFFTSVPDLPVDSVNAGLFFLPRVPGGMVTELRGTVPLSQAKRIMGFRTPLAPGNQTLSVEASAVGEHPYRAGSRVELSARSFQTGELQLSDILLAVTIDTPTREVNSRKDLRIRALPSTSVSDEVALYFEIYPAKREGPSVYDLTLELFDASSRSSVLAFIGSVARRLGGVNKDRTRITWRREYDSAEQDRLLEWLTIDLSPLDPGRYLIRVEVEDVGTGGTAEIERAISVVRGSGDEP